MNTWHPKQPMFRHSNCLLITESGVPSCLPKGLRRGRKMGIIPLKAFRTRLSKTSPFLPKCGCQTGKILNTRNFAEKTIESGLGCGKEKSTSWPLYATMRPDWQSDVHMCVGLASRWAFSRRAAARIWASWPAECHYVDLPLFQAVTSVGGLSPAHRVFDKVSANINTERSSFEGR